MCVINILQNLFGVCRSFIDLRNLCTLFSAVEALTRCRKLTIASIGRHLKRDSKVKNKIKTIDRLFGNIEVQSNVTVFYQRILRTTLGYNKNPCIIVDWSGLSHCGKFHFLRAAIPVGGRALPIFDIPFEVQNYASPKVHKLFLNQLKSMLPENCTPIIITDSGFRNPWFKLVESLGWDYVGRIRNRTLCMRVEENQWDNIKSLYNIATRRAKYLGHFFLAKSGTVKTDLYIYKEKQKNRIRKNLAGKKIQCSVSLKHSKRESEPLLIATSLSRKGFKLHEIINIYKRRMQIEESIRDLKSERIGLSLRQNRSISLERLSVALLIGAMTMFLLWVLGLAVKNKGLHYQYQANTIRNRNVLSTFTIGWQALEEKIIKFTKFDINQAVKTLRSNQYAE